MKFNFEEDVKIAFHNEFAPLGIKIPIRDNLYHMALDYLTVHKKIIWPHPREVHISRKLASLLPAHDKRYVIETIVKKLKAGKDVNPFQSKKLFQSNFHDHLLFEWRIHHLHLSFERDKKTGFVKQTNQLLFLYLDERKAILLDTAKHYNGVFADEKWLEILDSDFPEELSPYVIHNWKGVVPKLTPAERQIIWTKGYSIGLTEINGKIISSPGVGRMASGHNMMVATNANEVLRWVHDLTTAFQSYFIEICDTYKVNRETAVFKIKFSGPTLCLVELSTNQILAVFPHGFMIDRSDDPLTIQPS